MSKYFKQDETKKVKLSDYLKMAESEFKYFLCEEKYRGPRTKYIMETIGDVELDEDTYKLFLAQFQRCGGRYDVRTKPETFKGIYDFLTKYPKLTADALDEIWFVYIEDQFEAYAHDEMLGKYIELHGETDDAFESFIDYVDRKAKEYDARFLSEAATLEELKEEYGEDLIKHLQYIIKSQHIPAEQIISSLPCRELIDQDKEQLSEISRQTRIFFGACHPISYQMIESLAVGEGLDRYPEQPAYLINGSRTVDTTFTKEEFLASIKKQKEVSAQKQYKKQ